MITFAQSPVRYLGNTVDTGSEDYAGLLHPPVRDKAAERPDRTHAGLHALTDHLFEPPWLDHFHVVIHQRDKFRLAVLHTEVDEPAVIEFFIQTQKMNAWITRNFEPNNSKSPRLCSHYQSQ